MYHIEIKLTPFLLENQNLKVNKAFYKVLRNKFFRASVMDQHIYLF